MLELEYIVLKYCSNTKKLDVDECKANPCGSGALCTNIPGAYECSCPAGYKGNPTPADGCIDIDECTTSLTPICGIKSNCVNTPGGYFCQCPSGEHQLNKVHHY